MNLLPKHIAIIMDGNGRWAAEKNRSRLQGHRAGARSVREVVQYAAELKISYLTLYSFSVENWKRPQSEINSLMALLRRFLIIEEKTLMKNNIKFKVIGRINDLPVQVRDQINKASLLTKNNTGLTLILALSYGSRQEICDACKSILTDYSEKKIKLDEINEELINNYLYTKDIPDPDLLIRTSGEMRLSNFLLWQISYSEIWVTDKKWPDFNKDDFNSAIDSFKKRQRRYGGINDNF